MYQFKKGEVQEAFYGFLVYLVNSLQMSRKLIITSSKFILKNKWLHKKWLKLNITDIGALLALLLINDFNFNMNSLSIFLVPLRYQQFYSLFTIFNNTHIFYM